MLAGAGETITVLLAVTPVADTVWELEDHQAEVRVTVIVECHPLGACQVGVQLTLVSTSQLFHQLGTQVGIAQPSVRVLLLAHRTTRFHCVGLQGKVKASCFQLQVDFSVLVTNLFVVVESDISSASKVTAHVLEFTLVTVSVGVANFFQLLAVEYGSALSI